jgi:hypothetical protein
MTKSEALAAYKRIIEKRRAYYRKHRTERLEYQRKYDAKKARKKKP